MTGKPLTSQHIQRGSVSASYTVLTHPNQKESIGYCHTLHAVQFHRAMEVCLENCKPDGDQAANTIENIKKTTTKG